MDFQAVYNFIWTMSFSYIVLLTVVSFVMYSFMKEISFKYYAIYGILLISYLLLKNSNFTTFLEETLSKKNHDFIVYNYNWLVQVFFYIYYFLFCYFFLNLHKVYKKLTRQLKLSFKIVTLISIGIGIYAYFFQDFTLCQNFFIYVYVPFILLVSIISVRHGIQTIGPLKYYLLTGGILFILFALFALYGTISGSIDYPISFFLVGIVLENLFFGLGLALKFKLINDEKNRQENKALLLESSNKITALTGIVEGEEKERRRIASDLHDSIGSLLTAANLQLLSAKKENTNSQSLNKASEIVSSVSDEVRRIAHNMRPSTLEKIGLIPTLKEICDNLKNNSEIQCQLIAPEERIKFSDFQETNVFRIVQELISNIVKHARSKQLRMKISTSDHMCKITIKHDGIVFDPNMIEKKGMGLTNINQRVKLLNGSIHYKYENNIMQTTITFPIEH